MGPFEKPISNVDLAAITTPTRVDVEVRVVSPNDVASPVTGMRAAGFVIEIVAGSGLHTATPTYETVASLVVGDRLLVAAEGQESIVALMRQTKLVFMTETMGGHPITTAPAEIVPFLAKIPFGCAPCFREHAIAEGDRMRLRAMVERASKVVPSAYRSETRSVLVVRDDLGPAQLDELFDPAF